MHAIIITAYKDKESLHRLVDHLKSDFLVFIHIDKKSGINPNGFNGENVFAFKKYKVNWASYNHLAAIIFLLKKAIKHSNVEYFHIITGQDFPSVSNNEIYRFFEKNNEKSFFDYVNVSEMDDLSKPGMQARYQLRWFTDLFAYPKTFDFQSKLIIGFIERFQKKHKLKRTKIGEFGEKYIYKGLIYASLHREAVGYILDYIKKDKSFLVSLKTCLIPEEFFIQTILMNSPLKDTIVNDNLRYVNWEYRDGISPCILDERDYESVLDSKALFMRKVGKTSLNLLKKNHGR